MNLKFLEYKKLDDFPSGSAIEHHDDQLYLVGDDARYVLVMSKDWKMLETLNLFPSDANAVAGTIPDDCEATTIIHINKIPFLLMLGSGAMEPNRNKGVLMNLATRALEEINLTDFYNRLKQTGFEELNIESATVIDDKLILCNRGTKAKPDNRLIITSTDFWKKQQVAEIFTVKVELEEKPEKNMSLTSITYAYKNDWLILTASSESKHNNFDEGTAGDSFLCVIENAYRKTDRKRLKPNELFNLTAINKKFKGHKVESFCLQSGKEKKLKIHLVTHNEEGELFLFKVRLKE
ncbi:MAG: hypothetical protein WKF89_00880 [Chitinophagaceae bacterium]